MKKIGRLKIIIAFAICALLAACGSKDGSGPSSVAFANEEEIVDVIRCGLTTHNNKITISFTAEGEYMDSISDLTADLVNKALLPTDDPKQGDYIRYQYGGYEAKYASTAGSDGSYSYTIEIIPSYYTSLDDEEVVDERVGAILEEIKARESGSDYETVKAVHDYITDMCEFDWRNKNLAHRYVKSTAYGALVNGEATCQGYSVAACRLLREAGIDCRVITGYATSETTGETEYHAWNLVCLDGIWYNMDVSWDDGTDSYDYFLKCDETFSMYERDGEFDSADFRAGHPAAEDDYVRAG